MFLDSLCDAFMSGVNDRFLLKKFTMQDEPAIVEAILEGDVLGLREFYSIITNDYEVSGTFMVAGKTFVNPPLIHFSIIYQKLEVLNFMLSARLDPNLVSRDGMSPLHLAILMKQKDFVDLLLFFGAKPCIPNMLGHTALVAAINARDVDIVNSILNAGGLEKDSVIPLHLAVVTDQHDIAKAILEHGSDPNRKNSANKTAFDLLAPHQEKMREVLTTVKPIEQRSNLSAAILMKAPQTCSFSDLMENFTAPVKMRKDVAMKVTRV